MKAQCEAPDDHNHQCISVIWSYTFSNILKELIIPFRFLKVETVGKIDCWYRVFLFSITPRSDLWAASFWWFTGQRMLHTNNLVRVTQKFLDLRQCCSIRNIGLDEWRNKSATLERETQINLLGMLKKHSRLSNPTSIVPYYHLERRLNYLGEQMVTLSTTWWTNPLL